jgi:hypothetical protein
VAPLGDAPPPHDAFLDDLYLHLRSPVDDMGAAQVELVRRRLAAGGLRLRLDKSRAIAPPDTAFTSSELAILARMGVQTVDATTPPE